MPMLARYLSRTVLGAMLVVLGVISVIDLVFTLADEMGRTNRFYSGMDALVYVLRTFPTSVYELLPYVALGGALIGLGVLASSQELLIMQSSGIRTPVLVGWVMLPVVGVMLFSLALGEWIAPALQQQAQSERALIMSGGQAIRSEDGDWRKIGNEFIHVNAIAPGGRELFGVTVFELDDRRQMVRSSFAEQGEYVDDVARPYWRLLNVNETRFTTDRVFARQHDVYEWQVDMSPQLLSVLLVRPDRQSISGLYQVARYFDREGLDSSSYYLAFWKKLLQPLATMSLVLLAVSFVFGPLREATMGYRVFIAIAMGLGFTIIQRTMGPATILYGISPFVATLAPIVLCALIGAYLLRRV